MRSQQDDQLIEPTLSAPALTLPAGSVLAVLVGQPDWQPWGTCSGGVMIDPETGGEIDPSFHGRFRR
ncbi:hypothetical protein GCM10010530_57720 [Kribbella aluminosa]